MSDSDNNRRGHKGRGSLLDYVVDPPVQAAPSPAARRGSANPQSLLSAQPGSPRLSTRRKNDYSERETTSDQAGRDDSARAQSAADRFAEARRNFSAHITNLFDRTRPDRNFSTPQADPHPDAKKNDRRQQDYDYGSIGSGDYFERPLVDLSIMIGAVWNNRRLIVGTTILGAIAGVFLALATPHKYYAETRLFIDPREIRLTDDELRSPLMSTEAMIAMTDSQVAILTSTNVLIQVVDNLGLARDPEFNGSLNAGGISGGIALIKQLISGKDANSASETEALSNLRHSLNVNRDPKTFVVNIGVSSRDAEKSALIANAIVQTYLESESEAQSGLMERTSQAIDSRLEALRSDLNDAERAVENFKAKNDLISVGTELIDDQQITAINQQLANARAIKVSVGVKADGLKRADVADIIDGAFPEEFLSANLIELRKQYSQSKANADSLSSRLGPRHPQFIAASSALESIKGQIRSELRRIVSSSQSELQRAVETEQELASQLAVAKTRSLDNSEELVTLRELDRKATATRQIYEAYLKRSREASERGNFNIQNARVISPAEPPLDPDGVSRKIIAIGGMVLGAILGFCFALMLGLVESIRSYLPGPDDGSSRRTRRPILPGSPAAGHILSPAEPRIPPAPAATSENDIEALTTETTTEENLQRDDDMYQYNPAAPYPPYWHPAPHPVQTAGHPQMAYQPQPQYSPYAAPYQAPPAYSAQQPGYPANSYGSPGHPAGYPPQQPVAWGYGQPQPQMQPQPVPQYPAYWNAQPQPQHHPMQQPVPHTQYYPQHPVQAPDTQHQFAEPLENAYASNPDSHSRPLHRDGYGYQQSVPDSEISAIRQEMERLRNRIDNKNRRRMG